MVIVGAGPAGLAAAIRLKQISPDISVVVVEKGSEVGAHIMSGAVIDPGGLDALLPEWRGEDTPIKTAVTDDRFYMLGPAGAVRIPNMLLPPLMSNHGNFIVSLGNVCRWLATKAEQAGVEIYPGFAAAEVLYGADGEVVGVATGDMGRGQGRQAQGLLHPRHGIARQIHPVRRRRARPADQDPDRPLRPRSRPAAAEIRHRHQGAVASRAGPAQARPGAALVRLAARQPHRRRVLPLSLRRRSVVSVGFVVHLNYENPYLSPFEEFQRFKTHPLVRDTFAGGKRIGYGARAIAEGGWQSVPDLAFPGGALIGDGAGFLNVPRIKGTHNAMRSGMLAAEHVAAALAAGRSNDALADYEAVMARSAIGQDLWKVRNAKPLWSKLGTVAGIGLGGLDMWANSFGISPLGTLGHGKPDAACLKPAARCRPIAYPKPDGKLTFDRLSSVFLSNTNHEEDQPVHLKVADPDLQRRSELEIFAGPSARYCPAGVYEWIRKASRPALRHQCAELRPLQNLRHQGPQREHHLGRPGRRRRPELPEHVMSGYVAGCRARLVDDIAESLRKCHDVAISGG